MVKHTEGSSKTEYKKCKHLESFPSGEKELWLIRAPKGLDLSKLKELPVDFVGDGKSVFQSQGQDFEVKEEANSEQNGLVVLIPGEDKQTLVGGRDVSRVFSINEYVDLAQQAASRKREVSDEAPTPKKRKREDKDKEKDKKKSRDKKDKADKKEKKEKKHKHKNK
ncbi:LAFE_0G05094g1_1 [Lachancea fermentati]|uniref:LAFE_0G05094g1_1 n=1 Tax=Lachancea fermentati TaxID=4955 RepID=A0A1G4MH05_LACFM|nr:LAFE_0G05094g1_1 [Lachancea fermentati]